MQNLNRGPDPSAYWRHVVVATVAVLFLPVGVITLLQATGPMRSPVLSVVVAIASSVGVATIGSAYWTRRSKSREIVFGDLMVWNWLRRMRAERQLKKVRFTLGLDTDQAVAAELSPARQAEVLERLASTLEARDLYTHGHSRRVTRHAYMIAKAMGFPVQTAEKVRAAAAMHDVGKLNIPRTVLNKPGKLSDEEFDLIRRHPTDGAKMVEGLGDPEITAMIRHHHERIDGGGYPAGLSGSDIPLGARIIAVADTFDAITSSRPYRPARQHKQAIKVLKEESGRQLDSQAVDAFLSYYTGRRSIARWAFFTTAFQRVLAALAGPIESASASSITQGAVAVAASAALGTSLFAPAVQPHHRAGHNRHAQQSHVIEATGFTQASLSGGASRGSHSMLEGEAAAGNRHGVALDSGGNAIDDSTPGAPDAVQRPTGVPEGASREPGPRDSSGPKDKSKPASEPNGSENDKDSSDPPASPAPGDSDAPPAPVGSEPSSDSSSGDSDRDGSDQSNSGSGKSGKGSKKSGSDISDSSDSSGSSGNGHGSGGAGSGKD
jgi:putative nucleotidyltransferase with HDIG domain